MTGQDIDVIVAKSLVVSQFDSFIDLFFHLCSFRTSTSSLQWARLWINLIHSLISSFIHVHSGHRRHRCKEPGCDLIFDSYLESRRHFSAEHFKKMETCPKCGKQVTHHNFKHHLLTHSETRTVFVCTHDNCTRKYLSQHNLDAHVRNDHGPLSSVRLTCTVQGNTSVCGRMTTYGFSFAWRVQVAEHQSSYDKFCWTILPGCNKVFKAKATLKRHVLNIHNRPPNESQPKPRKSANRKIRDFARELAGYIDDDDPVEEENEMELASRGAEVIEEPVILEDDP